MKKGVWILLLIGVVLIIWGLIISVSGAECKTILTPICEDNENEIVKLEKCPSFYCVEDKDCDDRDKCNGVEDAILQMKMQMAEAASLENL